MDNPKRAPTALKVVAVIFILVGCDSALDILISLSQSRISVNFGVLGIFIGIGLLRFRRAWRTCALVFIWLALIGIPIICLLILDGPGPFVVRLFGEPVGPAEPEIALLFAAILFALSVWQYKVLKRADVARLFLD
jgi:hypothetical protein